MTARILYTAHTITKAEVTLNNTTHTKKTISIFGTHLEQGVSLMEPLPNATSLGKSREEEDARDLF